ncbi:MAG TPA: 50S ribosomal protein L6 [Candidatus Limnocylindria bacterium]|jgi:large subunit ribosomal protein L6|nr:50S ribosomal protein L6 [Candidatus Limnocylindria bacterium]
MSRIGKSPVAIPAKVKVTVTGNRVAAEGPKGKLELNLPAHTAAQVEGTAVKVTRASETSQAKAMHGLARSLINNMVKGVSEGFQKKLEIHGVGFKAAVQGTNLNLALGYSHPINYALPAGIKVTVEENTKLTVDGADKEMVGRVASEVRSFYPPEPYKGKGVRYVGEKIVRKEGKTVQ